MAKLTQGELQFIESIKPEVRKFLDSRTEIDIDIGVGSFILSENGNVYHGVPFGVARWIHGEENAIGNMITEEGVDARIKFILIVGAPNKICMPCGMCRVAIFKYGTEITSVLCADQSFSTVEKYSISELYPNPYKE